MQLYKPQIKCIVSTNQQHSKPLLHAMPYTYTIPDLSNLSVEQRITPALQTMNESPILHDGRHQLSLWQAVKDFSISRSTLTACYNGIPAQNDAYEHQQKLTRAEERILADWIKVQSQCGVPISPSTLGDHAEAIAGCSIGKSWPKRFMDHHPNLKTWYTQSLKKCHANNVNPATVNKFFDIFKDVVKEYNIYESDIYNMDEKGISLGLESE